MLSKTCFSALLALSLMTLARSAQAELVVTVGNLNLQPGATGSLDVFVRSTDGTDNLDTFNAELRIAASGGTRLEFVDPPIDAQLGDARYVFPLDNSFAAFLGAPSGMISASTPLTPNDTYIGGDNTRLGLGVAVPANDKLLFTLAVTADTDAAPAVGDTFTVSLIDSDFTYFLKPIDPETGILNYIPVTCVAGTVNIVPEQSTISLLVMGCFGMAFFAWNRR